LPLRAANAAVQAHGGYGYVDEYPVGKYLRDARVTTLYEGTSQIQKLLIGRALTGESAFAWMDELPPHITVQDAEEWGSWLEANHTTATEIWVVYWKKASGKPSIHWASAVEVALRFGWIDGLVKSIDEHRYMQRWTPRRPKSKWSNVNKEICLRLIDSGELTPMGLAAVEAGKASGEWDRAYTVRPATPVPDDLKARLKGEPRREGTTAEAESNALGPLARVARGHGGTHAHTSTEHDREGARDARQRSCRRRRSAQVVDGAQLRKDVLSDQVAGRGRVVHAVRQPHLRQLPMHAQVGGIAPVRVVQQVPGVDEGRRPRMRRARPAPAPRSRSGSSS